MAYPQNNTMRININPANGMADADEDATAPNNRKNWCNTKVNMTNII